MAPYPVHYTVPRPALFTRTQLFARLLAFVVLGVIGLSLGSLYVVAYLALPVFAAGRLAGGRDPADYLREDGPRILRALRWLAAIYAWFGLTAEKLPNRAPEETVELTIEPSGHPTPASALWRVVVGLPSAFALAIVGFVGAFVWVFAALAVLVKRGVGEGTFAFLAGVQRWALRLLAYQASLVEPYPPFALDEAPPALPAAPVFP